MTAPSPLVKLFEVDERHFYAEVPLATTYRMLPSESGVEIVVGHPRDPIAKTGFWDVEIVYELLYELAWKLGFVYEGDGGIFEGRILLRDQQPLDMWGRFGTVEEYAVVRRTAMLNKIDGSFVFFPRSKGDIRAGFSPMRRQSFVYIGLKHWKAALTTCRDNALYVSFSTPDASSSMLAEVAKPLNINVKKAEMTELEDYDPQIFSTMERLTHVAYRIPFHPYSD